jgi:hypothetical protein
MSRCRDEEVVYLPRSTEYCGKCQPLQGMNFKDFAVLQRLAKLWPATCTTCDPLHALIVLICQLLMFRCCHTAICLLSQTSRRVCEGRLPHTRCRHFSLLWPPEMANQAAWSLVQPASPWHGLRTLPSVYSVPCGSVSKYDSADLAAF